MDNTIPRPPHWSLWQKQLLRFFGLYFFIYFCTPFVDEAWDPVVRIAGRLLGIWEDITVYPNGSGDTTYNYIQVLCMLVLAFTGSIIWWIIDHKRHSYNTLLYWIMALLRYVLAYYLLSYGFSKIYQSQFPFPSFATLLKPYGDATPMNLAWTFMGYSYPYNAFTGMAEAVGGVLLLFRRTTMFGCLFAMTVLCNVVAMNFCFDIPVKLFSGHLLLATLFIAIPYMPRLAGFFLQQRDIPAMPRLSLYNTRKKRIAHTIIKSLILILLVWMQIGAAGTKEIYYPTPPLYGLYEVDQYIHKGDTMQPLITNTNMWRYLAIDKGNRGYIQTVNGKGKRYDCKIDTIKQMIQLKTNDTLKISLHYKVDAGKLYVSADTLQVQLHKKDPNEFRLVNTGFHWVNEYPNNK